MKDPIECLRAEIDSDADLNEVLQRWVVEEMQEPQHADLSEKDALKDFITNEVNENKNSGPAAEVTQKGSHGLHLDKPHLAGAKMPKPEAEHTIRASHGRKLTKDAGYTEGFATHCSTQGFDAEAITELYLAHLK